MTHTHTHTHTQDVEQLVTNFKSQVNSSQAKSALMNKDLTQYNKQHIFRTKTHENDDLQEASLSNYHIIIFCDQYPLKQSIEMLSTYYIE